MEEITTGIPPNKIDKEGPLQIYLDKKKKWGNRWATLCGSALYYQKKKGDDRIDGPFLIKGGSVSISTDHPNSKKKEICFQNFGASGRRN